MLRLALAIAIALPLHAQEPEREPPSKELVESVLDTLKRAFASGESGERLRALEAARDVVHEDVVVLVARGLKDKEIEVRTAALEILRYHEHPRALAELERAHAKNKEFGEKKDEARAELVLAIGQHASPGSLKLLARGSLDSVRKHTTRARIQALGRIRSKDAVEELIALMNKAGRGRQGQGSQFQSDLRLSLWALTGTDEGRVREDWQRWWNDNKRDLRLPEEPSSEPRQLAQRWRRAWATPEDGERKGSGRKQRGDDSSGDGPPLD